ncbi:MAG: hypothetical protein ACI92G_003755, partial [Candidatus Pelagisphaera sp.]
MASFLECSTQRVIQSISGSQVDVFKGHW